MKMKPCRAAKSKISTIVIVLVVVIGSFLFSVLLWLVWRFKEVVKGMIVCFTFRIKHLTFSGMSQFLVFFILAEYSTSCCRSRKNEVPLFDISRGTTEPSSELSGQYDLVGDTKQVTCPDMPLFNFNAIATATDNFSEQNKLGKGGFGPVYKVVIDP